MSPIFFDDVEIGRSHEVGDYQLNQDEIVAFAERWDPMPIHLDLAAAEGSVFGGLTASSAHLMAIKQRLVHELPLRDSVVAALGFDEVRFTSPGRPGDRLHIRLTWVAKRDSQSKPHLGVATHKVELRNQDGNVLVSHLDTILMRKRALVGAVA